MSSSDKARMYKNSFEVARDTNRSVIDAHEHLVQRSIEVVKINLLAISIVATGITFLDLRFQYFFVVGGSSVIISVWYCIQIFEPTLLDRGIGHKGIVEQDKDIKNGIKESDYYRGLSYTFGRTVKESREKYNFEKGYFFNSLYASMAAIALFASGFLLHLIGGHPDGYHSLLLILIPLIAWTGKRISNDH